LGASDVCHHLETLAGLRHALQSEYFHWSCRAHFGNRLAAIIEHRTHLAEDLPHDERIANAQRTLLNQSGSHRTTTAIEFCLQNDAGSQTRRAGTQVQNVRSKQDRFEQSVEVLLFLR
jgi:hypothetical protein